MNGNMRKKRIVKAGYCYHLMSRVAHRAFFLDDEALGYISSKGVADFCCSTNPSPLRKANKGKSISDSFMGL